MMNSPGKPPEANTADPVDATQSSAQSRPCLLIVGDFADPEITFLVTKALSGATSPRPVFLNWDEFAGAVEPRSEREARIDGDAYSVEGQGDAQGTFDWHSVRLVAFMRSERSRRSARLIDGFVLANPLVAVAEFYGPWCQGESRSGFPAGRVRRFPIARAVTELPRMGAQLSERGWCEWHVPRAILDDGLAQSSRQPLLPMAGWHIGTISSDNETLQTCSAVLQGWGATVQACHAFDPHGSGWIGNKEPDVWVVDCRYSIDEAISFWRAHSATRPRVVVLLGFGRERDRRRLQPLLPGALLVDKPFRDIDLLGALYAAKGQGVTVSQ